MVARRWRRINISDLAVVTLHGMRVFRTNNRICYRGADGPHADLLSLGDHASQYACKANSSQNESECLYNCTGSLSAHIGSGRALDRDVLGVLMFSEDGVLRGRPLVYGWSGIASHGGKRSDEVLRGCLRILVQRLGRYVRRYATTRW
jgi:hypothetical protein